jgi:archaemetzincin
MRFLVTIEFTGEREIERLRDQLEARFHTKVNVSGFDFDCRAFLDLRRNQYSSSAIVKQLERYLSTAACKILAVTGLDLYNPVLTFVFGEARLNGQCAVVSSYRLDNKFYGLPDNPALLRERLLKEAIHELGHTYGLFHCHNLECVMQSTTYVEGIDFKSSRFCDKCWDKLGNAGDLPENAGLISQAPGGVPSREEARNCLGL